MGVPLSENEQRILDQIEKHLQETDPGLVRDARSPSWTSSRSLLRIGVAMIIIGLAAMVATLRVHVLLAFVGFVVALIGTLLVERVLSRSPGSRLPSWDRSGSGSRDARD